MSAYSCIVPVDWKAVSQVIAPDWVRVVDGRQPASEFASRFGVSLDVDHDDDKYRFPPNYLVDVGWNGSLPFTTDQACSSSTHLAASGVVVDSIVLLGTAIIAAGAVDLAGQDAFASQPWNGYYSRLHWPPRVQVAGTKNSFHFLEVWFDVDDDPPIAPSGRSRGVYRYRPKEPDGALECLLGMLCLGHRTIPGVAVLSTPSAWPASDDPWLAGYLLPHEVRELAVLLAHVNEPDKTGDYELFPLFVDRVSRAASEGLGLVALHDFLFNRT